MQRLTKQNVRFTRAPRIRTSLTPATASPRRASRRGSVLLVVIGLLLVLLLLGMTFFTFATQEDTSAQYFSESAKIYAPNIDVDAMWDWALRHLIVGPNQNEQNSALWAPQSNAAASPNFNLPHKNSLLAGVYGTDYAPYSGAGIHLIAIDTNNDNKPDRAYVDQNYDGRPDGNPAGIPAAYQGDTFGSQSLLDINFSPAAQGVASNSGGFALPPTSADPDVDYTYPDINNLFLAYRGFAQNANGNSFQVVIPSFLRPQLLRTSNGMISDWYENSNSGAGTNTRRRMFRPHPSHVIANVSPQKVRFLKYGKDNQPGVAGVDDNGDGTIDNAIEEGWPGSDDFPFRVDRNLNGTRGEMGVFYNAASGVSGGFSGALLLDYDKDNDGDGIPDGVLIDLGYPASQLADGTWFIPMFSYTIYDADALVNMNIAGNIMGLHSASGGADATVNNGPAANQKFGYDPVTNGPFFISRSNQGLAVSEINPGWVLDTDPTDTADIPAAQLNTVLDQLRRYYGTNPATRVELANMELFNALAGRPNYDSSGTITEYLVGRWGEEQRLKDGVLGKAPSPARTLALYPGPGITGTDDDGDRFEGETTEFTGAIAFRHPLDFSGAGSFLDRTSGPPYGDSFGRKPLLLASGANLWLGYAGYHTTGTIPYFSQTVGNNLMLTRDRSAQMSASNWLLDHPMEVIADLAKKIADDEIFGIEEMEGLHRNPNDPDYSLVVSRLQQLMLVNLQLSSRAAQIRERMTVESWDRREFNLPHNSTLRTWEFNANINNTGAGAGKPEFPPVCVSSAGQLQSDEPIRPELRRWLEIEEGNVNSTRSQQRWNVNKFISSGNNDQLNWPTTPTNIAGAYQNLSVTGTGTAQLYQRNLTPHPTAANLGNTPITAPSATATNATTPNDLEYWARRDRQQMARDIYVMLYLFCGGMDFEVDLNNNNMLDPSEDINGNGQWDDVNYATTPNTPLSMGGPRRLYTEAQLKQMAQFAVNFVDAIDRDTVITKFEFDLDLSNGWNLDDDPFGTTGDTGDYNATTNPTGERMVVYGVEAQQMAFSEALVVRDQQVTDVMGNAVDHVATEFNDRQERFYSYIELHNVSPFATNLDADHPNVANRGHWQLAVMDQSSPANQLRELEFRGGSVAPGGTFTIASRTYVDSETTDKDSSGKPFPSRLAVDPNWVAGAPALQQITPGGTSPNLDLVLDAHDGFYRLSNSAGGGNIRSDGFGAVWGSGVTLDPTIPTERGRFLDSIVVPAATQFVTFKLRRRLNPTRQMPNPNQPPATYIQQEQDNPWVDVDEIVVNVRNFSLRDTDRAPEIQTQLTALQSKERYQPLDGRANALADHSAASVGTAWRAHSIGSSINQATQNMGGSFTLWQPHFDRDLATIPELFSIPLYGPSQARFLLPTGTPSSGAKLALVDSSNEALVASEVILRPQHPSNLLVVPPAVADPKLDNRWYRLLELMEVNNRAHKNVALASPRVPGKINLNTVRHTSVLGALLDDPYLLNYSTLASLDTSDNDGTNVRNWWNQFIRSRDQYDALSQLYLPGMANSRPFRSLQYVTANGPVADVEHTVLRGLPSDLASAAPGNSRRLFEVGTFNNHTNVTDANYTDAHTRHRLLSKIHGNTTTRSHVFYVWVSVDFHEAIEVPGVSDPITNEKAFQIGGRISGLQGHRMFAVIDRSQAEQLLNPNNPTQPFNLTNWKKMQLFRRTIE